MCPGSEARCCQGVAASFCSVAPPSASNSVCWFTRSLSSPVCKEAMTLITACTLERCASRREEILEMQPWTSWLDPGHQLLSSDGLAVRQGNSAHLEGRC